MAEDDNDQILGLAQDKKEYEKWGNMPFSIFVVDKTAVLMTQKLAFNICERSKHRYRVGGDGDSIEHLLHEIVLMSQNHLRDKDANDPGREVTAREFLVKVTSVFPNEGIDEMNRVELDSVLSEIRKICFHRQFRTLDFSEHRELKNIITTRQIVGDEEIKQIVKAFIVVLAYTVIFHNRIKIKKLIDIAEEWSLLDLVTVAALRENNRIRSEIVHVGTEGIFPEGKDEFRRRYQEFVERETETCFKCQKSKKSDFLKLILTNQDILHVFKHYNRLSDLCRDQKGELETLRVQLEAKTDEIARLNVEREALWKVRGEQEDENVRLRIRLQERAAKNTDLNNERDNLLELNSGLETENERLYNQLDVKSADNIRLTKKVEDQRQTIESKKQKEIDMQRSVEVAADREQKRMNNIRDQLNLALRSTTKEERESYIKSSLDELDGTK